MGLLSEGTPLSWSETQKHSEHVRQHGIRQFISLYYRLKDRTKDSLKWGDEVEYQLVRLTKSAASSSDQQQQQSQLASQLALVADQILPELQREEIENGGRASTLWRPEYAAYMVEGVPGEPYGHLLAHLNLVEANMRKRRAQVQSLLGSDVYALTLTAFPRLGCPDFCYPGAKPTPLRRRVLQRLPTDEVIYSGHPRFRIPRPQHPRRPAGAANRHTAAALPGHIYMDAMGFGMGCCCLQMTFQACSITEAYLLYDQLTPLSPVLLALSAASPVHRGWPLERNRFRIAKSRYDSIDSYLSADGQAYNDIPLTMDEDILRQLMEAGVEPSLSRHLAHLFIRDPSDTEESDHFENIQSTNWQSMRFKPPQPTLLLAGVIAAYVVFIVLLTRVLLTLQIDLLMPISKRDAVKRQNSSSRAHCYDTTGGCVKAELREFTLDEIVNGCQDFPGLAPKTRHSRRLESCRRSRKSSWQIWEETAAAPPTPSRRNRLTPRSSTMAMAPDSGCGRSCRARAVAASAASGPVHSVAKLSDSEQLARVLWNDRSIRSWPKRQASEIQG
uniref:Glutamate--cysteine ligase n=1 Tax=Macrostomum lignano TaxID=282301 RepID=A0A1I8F5X2_9PLAT